MTDSPRPGWFKHPLFPYLLLMVWSGILFLASSGEQSLMAHDEGWYAMQARWMILKGDGLTQWWWDVPIFDRMVGAHWLIAGAYKLFGVSDGVARLPSLVLGIGTVLLTFRLGCLLLPRTVAGLGALILPLCPLFLSHGRMATQDMPLVFVEVLLVLALVCADRYRDQQWLFWGWGLVAGACVGLGFLIKSVMIFLPVIALIPFFWNHKHFFRNPGLYLGLILGFILPVGWLLQSVQVYGGRVLEEMFGKLVMLGEKSYHGDGNIFYYFWNIPANGFPWVFFAVGGWLWWWLHGRRIQPFGLKTPMGLLLGLYPLILFCLLTLFSTRISYYSLQLYPWLALWAGVGLCELSRQWQRRWLWIRGISGGLALLGLGLWGVAIGLRTGLILADDPVRAYIPLGVIVGAGWLVLGITSVKNWRRAWVWTWLLTSWLGLTTAGFLGLIGNYSPGLKTELTQVRIASILQTEPIHFLVQEPLTGPEHQTWVLLSFYTPNLGERLPWPLNSPPSGYAWVSPNLPLTDALNSQAKTIATVEQWRLLKFP
ncbi:glycosyltransferase family 39 protein [Synechococcus sp. PCC 6312]|uniref:ArnT family glycosyltransferase n=1 Tax=Synechococcus sp. (strain ATCC 27167 / PCC 6312) TaxID=195253 RepID=UPI00029F2F65|nr:glycosyltransferase family 39 protein [Synechococcus sp. PCC 6312]AFY59809.1 PMT family glycosyltransferase, 4-amino-4-deoxy-L-arabinose transferase [Synechococcus sp. PCC 6312]